MDANDNSKDIGALESLIKMYRDGFLNETEFKKAKAKIIGYSDNVDKSENKTEEPDISKLEASSSKLSTKAKDNQSKGNIILSEIF